MNANRWAAIGIFVVALTAGCYVPSGPTNVFEFSGNVSESERGFRMTGDLFVSLQAAPHHNYSDVSPVLYDRTKREIETIPLGDMSTNPNWGPTKRRVNITTDERPRYVIVRSPDFWEDNDVQVISFVIQNGDYYEFARTVPEDSKFPCEVADIRVNATHC